jgi:exo-beta-1,3-glucanase (GH17 family)
MRRSAMILMVLLLCEALFGGCAAQTATERTMSGVGESGAARAFEPVADGRWIGNAVAYGPHRDGQAPGVADPSRLELLEDLRILTRHWRLIRVYGSLAPTPEILSLIREERLPLRVFLGVWLAPEDRRDSTGAIVESFPGAVRANQEQVEAGIRLARAYPDIVIAVCAGNETQVSWSAHRFPAAQLIRDIRALRAGVRQPVTTADDFNFWNRPESRAVASEIDFITMHAHPLWNGRMLDEAPAWTAATVESIRAFHPGRWVVLGETGWATRVHTEGEQARLIRGEAGEAGQRTFHRAVTAWAESTRTTLFFFEAFDENWKGGPHPNEVEKHWGLFRADRTPKAAMTGAR